VVYIGCEVKKSNTKWKLLISLTRSPNPYCDTHYTSCLWCLNLQRSLWTITLSVYRPTSAFVAKINWPPGYPLQNSNFNQTVPSPPGFENYLCNRAPNPLPPPPKLLQNYSSSAHCALLKPSILLQPDYPNPPSSYNTIPTPITPILNPSPPEFSLHLSFKFGGLLYFRCAELCFFLCINRCNLVLPQETNVSSSMSFKVSGSSVFRADWTHTRWDPAFSGKQNLVGKFSTWST